LSTPPELRDLMSKLRQAGWKAVPGAYRTYQHPDGATIELEQFRRYGGYHKPMVFWRWLLERGEMPATSEAPF
jgi:hypothetical protein